MFSRRKFAPFLFALSLPCLMMAQEVKEKPSPPAPVVEPTTPPVIWRGTMKNVLIDAMARLPFGKSTTFRAPIAVHFPDDKAAFCWDATACRILCAWKGEFLAHDVETKIASPAGELAFLAAGPSRFSSTVGAYGSAKYFGLKLIAGVPEFHYSIGRLGVRERISFSKNAEAMLQHFSIENAPGEVMIVIPDLWKDRISSKKGKLKDRFLTLTRAEAADFTLSYSLTAEPESTDE